MTGIEVLEAIIERDLPNITYNVIEFFGTDLQCLSQKAQSKIMDNFSLGDTLKSDGRDLKYLKEKRYFQAFLKLIGVDASSVPVIKNPGVIEKILEIGGERTSFEVFIRIEPTVIRLLSKEAKEKMLKSYISLTKRTLKEIKADSDLRLKSLLSKK